MEIKTTTCRVWYNIATATVFFQGFLRLNGMEEYGLIEQFLNDIFEQEPPKITLNLQALEFINSSGISMLSKFVIEVRKKKNIQMSVIGSQQIPWQGRSLKNLQRLMPYLRLELI